MFRFFRYESSTFSSVYLHMSREEKSYFWHILIKKITAEKERFVIEWNGFGTSIIPRKETKEEGGKTHQVWRRGEELHLVPDVNLISMYLKKLNQLLLF